MRKKDIESDLRMLKAFSTFRLPNGESVSLTTVLHTLLDYLNLELEITGGVKLLEKSGKESKEVFLKSKGRMD